MFLGNLSWFWWFEVNREIDGCGRLVEGSGARMMLGVLLRVWVVGVLGD